MMRQTCLFASILILSLLGRAQDAPSSAADQSRTDRPRTVRAVNTRPHNDYDNLGLLGLLGLAGLAGLRRRDDREQVHHRPVEPVVRHEERRGDSPLPRR